MSDVVDEMEQWRDYDYSDGEVPYDILTRAMREIERLRAELAIYESVIENHDNVWRYPGCYVLRNELLMAYSRLGNHKLADRVLTRLEAMEASDE